MNIGIDISSLVSASRTGVGEYTYELLNALFHIDTQNQYFLFYNSFSDVSALIPQWKRENVHIVQTTWPNKIFHVSIQVLKWPQIDRIIEKKTGVVLDYFFSPNIGFQVLSPRCKHILTVHDLSFEIFPEFFSSKMRLWHTFLSPQKQCERAHSILTPSENTKRDIVDLYKIDPKKIHVLTPGVAPLFHQENNVPALEQVQKKYNLGEKYILFLGTIEPRKNIEAVVRAFEQSPQLREAGYELILAGAAGWKNRRILKSIEQSEGVRYIGYVDSEEKPFLYRGASLFVYPSLYEGFGFPVLEAMASGIPVITSSRSSLPEIAGGGVYYVNPLHSAEIAEGFRRLLKNQSLQDFFTEKAKLISKQFDWNTSAKHFLSFL